MLYEVITKTVQYLISSNILFDGGDYKVVYSNKITRTFKENGEWQKNDIVFPEPQQILYLSISRVFGLYKTQALREGDKPLPDATVEYYLKNSPAFICDSKKVSFKKMDAKSGYRITSYNVCYTKLLRTGWFFFTGSCARAKMEVPHRNMATNNTNFFIIICFKNCLYLIYILFIE